MAIRMMLPFTMCCSHCGEYLYIATKFNSRCEKIQGTTELGLNAYRFFGACKHCKGEFIFRTDPEHCDYVLESGGTRTYEAFKDADYAEAEVAKAKAEQEASSDSQALENKIYDTAEEMRRIEELGELRSINKREARRHEAIHHAIERITKSAMDDEDPELVAMEERKLEEEFRDLKRGREEMGESGVPEPARRSVSSSSAPLPKKPNSGLNFSALGIKIKPKVVSNLP